MHTVYIKPELSAAVNEMKVTVGDVCQVFCNEEKLAEKIRELELFRIEKAKKQKVSFSVVYLLRCILAAEPGIQVVNLGEPDFVVQYMPPHKEKKWLEYAKAVLVGVVVFFGSAFTIMTFNEDANVSEVFTRIYENIAGRESGNNLLEISYALGLPLGILLFFNHFATARLSADPTPLQIQMRQYEQQEDAAIIENAARKGERME